MIQKIERIKKGYEDAMDRTQANMVEKLDVLKREEEKRIRKRKLTEPKKLKTGSSKRT